jgi:hypothetical protein
MSKRRPGYHGPRDRIPHLSHGENIAHRAGSGGRAVVDAETCDQQTSTSLTDWEGKRKYRSSHPLDPLTIVSPRWIRAN